MSIEEYRAKLEAELARNILALAVKDFSKGIIVARGLAIDECTPAVARSLFSWEINGLCIAARLLGGYDGLDFEIAWVRNRAAQ